MNEFYKKKGNYFVLTTQHVISAVVCFFFFSFLELFCIAIALSLIEKQCFLFRFEKSNKAFKPKRG